MSYFGKEFREYNAERFDVSFRAFAASWNSFSKEAVGRIPVSNSSGGLLKPLIDPFLDQSPRLTKILLVSEPAQASQEVQDYINSRVGASQADSSWTRTGRLSVSVLESLIGESWSPDEPSYDLTSSEFLIRLMKEQGLLQAVKSDLIILQSVLEHVGDPVRVLDNLLALRANEGAVLAIQTCNPAMRLHRHPIDTLRFHEDFFLDFAHRRGLEVFVKNSGASIFAFIAEELGDSLVSSLDKSL
jgi:hypothetical protein